MSLVVDTVRSADAGTVELRASGTLDVATVLVLRDAISAATAADAPQRVLVDLGGVDFMDSSGIGAVVRGLRHCQAAGVAFALRCASAQPLRLLRMTGLDRVVDVEVPPSSEPLTPA